MNVVISLCDLTGHMVEPWVEAGYSAILVDPQHATTTAPAREGVIRVAATIEDAMPTLARIVLRGEVSAVFGFPPCTDMAVSGARWFAAKREADPPKRTCLWTGGGFVMPPPARDASLGAPDDRIHKAPPGPERENFRSATPRGFARAVFEANARAEKAA